jgi:hypothetical protein
MVNKVGSGAAEENAILLGNKPKSKLKQLMLPVIRGAKCFLKL